MQVAQQLPLHHNTHPSPYDHTIATHPTHHHPSLDTPPPPNPPGGTHATRGNGGGGGTSLSNGSVDHNWRESTTLHVGSHVRECGSVCACAQMCLDTPHAMDTQYTQHRPKGGMGGVGGHMVCSPQGGLSMGKDKPKVVVCPCRGRGAASPLPVSPISPQFSFFLIFFRANLRWNLTFRLSGSSLGLTDPDMHDPGTGTPLRKEDGGCRPRGAGNGPDFGGGGSCGPSLRPEIPPAPPSVHRVPSGCGGASALCPIMCQPNSSPFGTLQGSFSGH